MPAASLTDVEDRADMRMIERGGRLRFPQEPLDGRGVGRELRGQKFHGDRPVEPTVFRPVDDPHPAIPELFEEPVRAEGLIEHWDVPGW